MIGVQLLTETLERGVDLDRVDVRCALPEGDGDVVAASRAHDQHVAGIVAQQVGVRVAVERLLGEKDVDGRHRLVSAIVDQLEQVTSAGECARLRVLRRTLAWQQTVGGIR